LKGKNGWSQDLKILNIQSQYSLLEVKSLRSVLINISQGLALINLNHLLLTLLFVVTSCNGQVKTDLPNDNINQQTPIEGVQIKIVRTQGVTSGNITCELQDIVGNLWFSTDGEGVYRFDGKSFTNFTTKDGICDNYTSDIIQDKSGNILIGTNSGICKYDGKIFSN
jgi:ligand-binding sensor domain-containing protein